MPSANLARIEQHDAVDLVGRGQQVGPAQAVQPVLLRDFPRLVQRVPPLRVPSEDRQIVALAQTPPESVEWCQFRMPHQGVRARHGDPATVHVAGEVAIAHQDHRGRYLAVHVHLFVQHFRHPLDRARQQTMIGGGIKHPE